MLDLTISIVIYKYEDLLDRVLQSCLNSNLNLQVLLIDNSSQYFSGKNTYKDPRIKFISTEINLGYATANNLAMRLAQGKSKYHLVLNPDVYFEPDILQELFDYMESNLDVGLLMPTVCSLDGSTQNLCKMLPSPFALFFRRFSPLVFLNRWVNFQYEMQFADYNNIMEVCFLSGCFMFLRTEVFDKVGYFDDRFFLYMEDVDYCRRIHQYYRTVYYPRVKVYHKNNKGSYKSLRLLHYHMVSAIMYFNKWGWFFDTKRKRINKRVLDKIKK